MASSITSRGVLTDVGNVDRSTRRSKLHKKPDVSLHYPWCSEGNESLSERKKRADERREELLVLLYRDDLTTSQVEGLINEWVSLVAERDKLLHEEISKKKYIERTRYVQELQRILRDRSLLGEGSEEMDIREALFALDRQVSHYCRSHGIPSPLHTRTRTQVITKGEEVPLRESDVLPATGHQSEQQQQQHQLLHSKSNHKLDLLDHETGQTGTLCLNQSSFESSTPKQSSINEEWDGEHCNTDSDVTQVPSVMLTQPPGGSQPVPHPPTPPPLPINPSNWLLRGGTVGTVQFPRSRSCNDSEMRCTSTNDDLYSRDAPDPSFIDTPDHERKTLMDEISSVGQSVLRRTTRARSPGGTPIKHSKRLTLTGNTDMLQRALISKFRSLHSTPIPQNGVVDHGRGEEQSFDFSNTWSDVNNSVAYDDPDLSITSNSGLSSNQSGSLASTSGYSQPPRNHDGILKRRLGVFSNPNTSSAV